MKNAKRISLVSSHTKQNLMRKSLNIRHKRPHLTYSSASPFNKSIISTLPGHFQNACHYIQIEKCILSISGINKGKSKKSGPNFHCQSHSSSQFPFENIHCSAIPVLFTIENVHYSTHYLEANRKSQDLRYEFENENFKQGLSGYKLN